MNDWLLYGATGFTGQLLVAEAVRRGHRPLLAGRSRERLARLAESYDLPYAAVPLNDEAALLELVTGRGLVLHAAGPFVETSGPMLAACLATGVHYLDITGEIPVFENSFARDAAARNRGIAVISGVGFDVVPTDCLAVYVARQLAEPVRLELAFETLSSASAGTLKSMLRLLPAGGLVRRNGRLVAHRLGRGERPIRLPVGERPAPRVAYPIPWGDLVTAYHSTGIPNITTSMVFSGSLANLRWLMPLAPALGLPGAQSLASRLAGWFVTGPDERLQASGRSAIWAQAADAGGRSVEAWLTTLEPYRFTAIAAIRCVEETLAKQPVGALSPAMAFGPDLVLQLPGTQRFDRLPDHARREDD